jgi:hypothetical protein
MSQLHPLLHSQFLQEGLQEAILDAHCPRLMKFILKPVSIMRNGWLLAPDLVTEQNKSRAYILPSQPHKDRPFIGQRLEIHRPEHRAVLISFGDTLIQRITLDLNTFTVVEQTVEMRSMS